MKAQKNLSSTASLCTTLCTALLCAALCTALGACSSAPKAPEGIYSLRNEAASLADLGAKALRQGIRKEALRFYEECYRMATSVDDAALRIAALDGLSKLLPEDAASGEQEAESVAQAALSKADPRWGRAPTSAYECRGLAAEIAADSGLPVLAALADLIQAEASLRKGGEAVFRQAETSALSAVAVYAKKPAEKTRALRILAEARKGLNDMVGGLSALEAAAALDLKQKRFADYAADRYLAASIHSKAGNFTEARSALLQALEADRRVEHSAGMGADYRALGLVAEKEGNKEEAARFYEFSREIFAAANIPLEASDAEARRSGLE